MIYPLFWSTFILFESFIFLFSANSDKKENNKIQQVYSFSIVHTKTSDIRTKNITLKIQYLRPQEFLPSVETPWQHVCKSDSWVSPVPRSSVSPSGFRPPVSSPPRKTCLRTQQRPPACHLLRASHSYRGCGTSRDLECEGECLKCLTFVLFFLIVEHINFNLMTLMNIQWCAWIENFSESSKCCRKFK